MNQFSFKHSYHRNLPHIQIEGATLFVTFRLAGSLPVEVIKRLSNEKETSEFELAKIRNSKECTEKTDVESRRLFGKWDDALDTSASNVRHLADPRIADLVSESLRFRDGKVYELIAFCIMPNHVHVVFTPLKESDEKYFSLSHIMHSLKRHTAREANLILGCEGEFWQHESYDRVVRNNSELERIVKYVLYNPVKAGLTDNWQNWKWNYYKYSE